MEPNWGGGDDGHEIDEQLFLAWGGIVCRRCKTNLRGMARYDVNCTEMEARRTGQKEEASV